MKILTTIFFTGLIFVMSCSTARFYDLPQAEFADFDYGYAIKYHKIKNINVAAIDEGTSDDLIILIHGLGSNAKGWIKNIPELSKDNRVISLDLPGYGKSQKGHFQFSMDFYAEIIKLLVEKIPHKSLTLIGHSMGGQIAMITALNYPKIVDKLVLISPAGFETFTEGEAAWFKKAVTPELIKDTPIRSIDVNLKSNFYNYPKDAEFMITERIQMRRAEGFDLYCYAVAENVAGMVNAPVYDKLEKIEQPALIVFGENDQLIPNPYLHGGFTKDIAEIGYKKIPGSVLLLVPESGHFVQFEKSEQVNKAILGFLNDEH